MTFSLEHHKGIISAPNTCHHSEKEPEEGERLFCKLWSAWLLVKKVLPIPLSSWLQDTTPLHQGGLAEVHHKALIMSQAFLEKRTKAQMGNYTSITWSFTSGIHKNQLSFLLFDFRTTGDEWYISCIIMSVVF